MTVRLHLTDNQRSRTQPTIRFVLLTAIIIVVIVYGSLYPFEFRTPAEGEGALNTLLRSWAEKPGRGDLVANILLYMPLGWLGMLSLPQRMSVGFRLFILVVLGTALSVSMELTQYFDVDRVTAATDVYANSTGTILGSLSAICVSIRRRIPFVPEISANPIPVALVAAWIGYRLYPYVPTVDLHKYWGALKPVILYPTLPLDDLCRHSIIWLTIFGLTTAIIGRR